VAPPIRLCTDNAVMVAWAGLERLRLGWADDLEIKPRPRWPLTDLRPNLPLPPGEGPSRPPAASS
ncbi:MAG TPA: hypothetical protein VE650_11785, partial [Acetobacteraceae bacterium]|nr:hypothetical protein [Acetobacteraceae bacterium]